MRIYLRLLIIFIALGNSGCAWMISKADIAMEGAFGNKTCIETGTTYGTVQNCGSIHYNPNCPGGTSSVPSAFCIEWRCDDEYKLVKVDGETECVWDKKTAIEHKKREAEEEALEESRTPLHLATKKRNSTKVEIKRLLGAGADVNAKDKSGDTPLLLAIRHSRKPEIISVLLKAGADVNAKDQYGGTPLQRAWRSSEIVKLLKSYGASE